MAKKGLPQPKSEKPPKPKAVLVGAFPRNVIPFVLAGLSAATGAFLLFLQLSSDEKLPTYLLAPCIVAVVFQGVFAVTSLACWAAFHVGQSYHKKNATVHYDELRTHHHIRSWGLMYIYPAAAILAFTFSGAYLYMLLCIVTPPGSVYCITFDNGKQCAAAMSAVASLGITFLILILVGCVNVYMTQVIAGVEYRWTEKQTRHYKQFGQRQQQKGYGDQYSGDEAYDDEYHGGGGGGGGLASQGAEPGYADDDWDRQNGASSPVPSYTSFRKTPTFQSGGQQRW